jgi:hypothetical protein
MVTSRYGELKGSQHPVLQISSTIESNCIPPFERVVIDLELCGNDSCGSRHWEAVFELCRISQNWQDFYKVGYISRHIACEVIICENGEL